MASPPAAIADPRATRLLSLTDEILEEIFLRLPTPTDLARASTACGAFRRVITDRGFLRRFEAVHAPPFVGLVSEGQDGGFYPAQPPHPSAPLGRAVASGADFSYSFVPIGKWLKPWRPRDHRQGRVLLECLPKYDNRYPFDRVVFLTDLELVVCDPLHRRYVMLPPIIPQELTAQRGPRIVDFDSFLAPAGQDEAETSFKVICTGRNTSNLFAFVFSSVTGRWSLAASPSWSSLGTEAPGGGYRNLAYPDYACGCFYWTGHWAGKLLVLDASNMEFSIVNSVPASNIIDGIVRKSGVVAGAEGTPLMFFFGSHREDNSLDVLHITKLNTSEPNSDQQQMEKIIPLVRQRRYSICGVAEGFLVLHGIPVPGGQPLARRRQRRNPNREYFLLDVRTSELQKVCEMKHDFSRVHQFSGSAPSLLKPCV